MSAERWPKSASAPRLQNWILPSPERMTTAWGRRSRRSRKTSRPRTSVVVFSRLVSAKPSSVERAVRSVSHSARLSFAGEGGIAEEGRGLLGRDGIDVEARAPLEPRHLGAAGEDLDVPVEVELE